MLKILLLLFVADLAFGQSTLLILGDSLTAGYGVEKEEAFPYLLEKKFQKDKLNVKIVSSGVPGSTSASGLSRMNWQLKMNPTHILMALGSNDALRGFKTQETEENLRKTIAIAKAKKIKIFISGLKAPPNYGPDFSMKFEKIFKTLANEFSADLLPFLLEGVAGEKSLNQSDGIHPNAKGHQVIAENLYSSLKGKFK